MVRAVRTLTLVASLLAACGSPSNPTGTDSAPPAPDARHPDGTVAPNDPEQNASDQYDAILTDSTALAAFLRAMPKGGDLHNHLTGAVYAETYLDWARADGDCINSSSYASVIGGTCGGSTQAVPTSGAFYDAIVRAWSMQDFVAGAQNGHDHFFATFGKYGPVAGIHRDDDLADIATRAAAENEIYIETMFNLGKNVGTLAAQVWTQPVTAANLDAFHTAIITNSGFATAIAGDVATVQSALSGYRAALHCDDSPTDACDVSMRFIAQVSRTGASDQVFGQLVAAYEIAQRTPQLVAANLSSPEDDSASINNYDLHMAMLDYLYGQYTTTGASPLHVTLHAGELVPQYLPPGSTANTFHIRAAVETGHAERIGHGVDVESETDPDGLLTELHDRGVMIETCLSSNAQILEVSGTAHPLAIYLSHGVPVALATDDQGVSRSSMAGEYLRAALDQHLTYRQLKLLARTSLEHAFLPGASLWTALGDGTAGTAMPTSACVPAAGAALGDPPGQTCSAFLATSERATLQYELERRFLSFERGQPQQ